MAPSSKTLGALARNVDATRWLCAGINARDGAAARCGIGIGAATSFGGRRAIFKLPFHIRTVLVSTSLPRTWRVARAHLCTPLFSIIKHRRRQHSRRASKHARLAYTTYRQARDATLIVA